MRAKVFAFGERHTSLLYDSPMSGWVDSNYRKPPVYQTGALNQLSYIPEASPVSMYSVTPYWDCGYTSYIVDNADLLLQH